MTLFRRKRTPSASLIAAFVTGSVVTLGAIGYGVSRLVRNRLKKDGDEEVTDFSDPYIPAPARRGSRKAVHAMV